jgi:hypothetical protein
MQVARPIPEGGCQAGVVAQCEAQVSQGDVCRFGRLDVGLQGDVIAGLRLI